MVFPLVCILIAVAGLGVATVRPTQLTIRVDALALGLAPLALLALLLVASLG